LLPPVAATGAGAGAGADPAEDEDEPDDRGWDDAPDVMVRTTGRAVNCTGCAAAAGADGSATGATAGVPGTVAAGIRWITTCTGGAIGAAGGTGAGADEPLPLTGFWMPKSVTMPNMPVAPSPAATIRLR